MYRQSISWTSNNNNQKKKKNFIIILKILSQKVDPGAVPSQTNVFMTAHLKYYREVYSWRFGFITF